MRWPHAGCRAAGWAEAWARLVAGARRWLQGEPRSWDGRVHQQVFAQRAGQRRDAVGPAVLVARKRVLGERHVRAVGHDAEDADAVRRLVDLYEMVVGLCHGMPSAARVSMIGIGRRFPAA